MHRGKPTERSSPLHKLTAGFRSARWADNEGQNADAGGDAPTPPEKDSYKHEVPEHPIEILVASLLDPPDMDQRIEDYEW